MRFLHLKIAVNRIKKVKERVSVFPEAEKINPQP